MTGIFLLVVVGLWLWACIAITFALMRRLGTGPWRWLVGPVVFVALLIAPLADEIVGGIQFKAMCEREAVLKIDAEKVRGRTMRRLGTELPPPTALLQVERWRESFVDASTGEELISYVWLRAGGGWLIRALHISDGNAPLLINPSTCDPRIGTRLDKKFEFTLIAH